MTFSPLVSVIIPIYNPGPYLHKCLDSVCGQTLEKLEIICVNDGSTDASMAVLQARAAIDPRITVLSHTKNRGCAAARNTGLDAAHGIFVHFLDSDDWIDAGYLEELARIAEKEHLPLVMNSNIILENEDGTSTLFEPGTYAESIGFSTTGFVDYKTNIGNFTYSNCCCLYRRDYIERLGVRFPEGLDYTDNYFHIATSLHQKQIYITNINAYHYMRHSDSICGKDSQKMERYDIFYVYKYIYDYYKKNGFIDTCKINFFELNKHFPRFSDKSIAFSLLFRLFSLMKDDIEDHLSFYSNAEKKFFYDVIRCRRYLFYEYMHLPLDSKLTDYFSIMRNVVRDDMKKRREKYHRLAELRHNVKIKMLEVNLQ